MTSPPVKKTLAVIAVVASLLIAVGTLAVREVRKGKLSRQCGDGSGHRYIKLTMGECFGPCSVYALEFYSDGKLKWSGIRNVKKTGTMEDNLSPTLFSKAITVLDRSGLADDVDHLSGGVDSQMVSIEVQCGTYARKIRYSNESADTPERLQGLDARIINILALNHLVH